jgi:DNA-binding CsgD family transcriptional regulator
MSQRTTDKRIYGLPTNRAHVQILRARTPRGSQPVKVVLVPPAPARQPRQAPVKIRLVEHAELIGVLDRIGGASKLRELRPAIRLLRQVLSLLEKAAASERRFVARNAIASDLGPRLGEVLHGLKLGLSEKQIANELQISVNTVHVYTKELYRRFNVNTRAELLALWLSG